MVQCYTGGVWASTGLPMDNDGGTHEKQKFKNKVIQSCVADGSLSKVRAASSLRAKGSVRSWALEPAPKRPSAPSAAANGQGCPQLCQLRSAWQPRALALPTPSASRCAAELPHVHLCISRPHLPSSIAEPRYSQLIKSRDPHRDRKKLRVIPTMKEKSLCCDTNKSKLSRETLKEFKTCSKHTSRETYSKVCLQCKECGSMALWGSCNRWSNK